MNPLEQLPRFTGIAWRAPSGYQHSHGITGADVLAFEETELGNEWPAKLSSQIRQALQSVHASQVIWVARDEATASTYGEPEKWVVGSNARLIYEDEDGALIWDPMGRSALSKTILKITQNELKQLVKDAGNS